jgi:hypothetical protein
MLVIKKENPRNRYNHLLQGFIAAKVRQGFLTKRSENQTSKMYRFIRDRSLAAISTPDTGGATGATNARAI